MKTYPDAGRSSVVALTDVSLSVAPGELVAMVGPSGSGKSTLLQLVGALDLPTDGFIEVDDVRISSLSERERTRFRRDHVGFIFQAFHLVPSMTVIENVALSAIVRDARRSQWVGGALDLLESVGLGETAWRLPHQLSGGQKQRVAVARALFAVPKILLADEPTGNLDAESRDVVLRLIRGGVGRSTGTIGMIVTHDPIAASYADRVIAVHDGRLVGEIELGVLSPVASEEEFTRVERIRAWMAAAPV